MAQYIDKDALVAEIEKTYKFHEKRGNEHDSSICDVLYGLSHRISTLKVKEVDLEKELNFVKDAYYYFTSDERSSMKKVAKHFFELGMQVSNKAQKGEEV